MGARRHSTRSSRYISFLFIVAVAFCTMSAPLFAQNTGSGNAETESTSLDDVSRQRLENLITTLEDEAERDAFIANLRTLLEAEEAQEEQAPRLVSELLGLDEESGGASSKLAESLKGLGLSGSDIGALAMVLVIGLGIGAAVLVNKWLAGWINRRLGPLRRRFQLSPDRFAALFRIQTLFGYIFGSLLFLYAMMELLTFWPDLLLNFINAASLTQYALIILVVALVFTAIWETSNALLEYGTHRSHYLNNPRMQTLLAIARNVLLFVLLVMAALILLSEIGIDIVPLLAGAGVLGIAIGFGAQTLVQDVLKGFIVIFEDLLRVGDVVTVADRGGVVEKITIRKIQLRGLDGTVYTVPFSEVSVVDNLTKEFSFYLLEVGVAYREDMDEVMDCLREILEQMRQDEAFSPFILDALEVLGVDKFADSAVIIKARIKTPPGKQWSVGREFNRRMKQVFDQRNIEIPFPHQTIYFGEDKNGLAPKAPIRLFPPEDREQTR